MKGTACLSSSLFWYWYVITALLLILRTTTTTTTTTCRSREKKTGCREEESFPTLLLVFGSARGGAYGMSTSVGRKLVSEFAARPFVRRALRADPKTPRDVLSFFFGTDYYTSASDDGKEQLREGSNLQEMTQLWFGGGTEYDDLCRNFVGAVRDAGKRRYADDPDWSSTVDGLVAQVALCDQLARNLFRGTSEAYEYDDVSLQITRSLADEALSTERYRISRANEENEGAGTPEATKNDNNENSSVAENGGPAAVSLSGEFYPGYYSLMTMPLMHSETKADHETALKLLARARAASPDHLQEYWDNTLRFELDHKRVVDRFGRYPHRNSAKGRTSTEEELEWLSDIDNLPGWAKIQK